MSKKGAAPQKPTMKISTGLKKKLKTLRTEENGLEKASLEEVIAWLLKGHGATVDVEDAEDEASPGPEKKRKVNVRDPLYSLEILSEREGMLYYLTGFERSEVDLLVERFGEVRMSVIFFACSTLHAHAPLWCLLF
jgi:hypothetical protein